MRSIIRLCLLMCVLACNAQDKSTFRNPLLSKGPDPWVTQLDGYYYYMHTMGDHLELWKTDNMARLKDAPHKTIWTPPASGDYCRDIWAPEIHFLQGKWYVYFAADNGDNRTHRIYVLENSSRDPMQGTWEMKGKITDSSDKWAIDASIIEHRNKLYMIWSGWEGDANGEQDIYIAEMKDPLTIAGPRLRISRPYYDWEKHGALNDPNLPHVYVNEGPQLLKHGSRLFIVYSASACWTDNYALGMLVADSSSNLLDTASWKKWPKAMFLQSPAAGVYAPGHNSFFTTNEGKQSWILYHANDHAGDGCGDRRSPRMQPFTWDEQGMPVFGEPISVNTSLPIP